MHTEPSEASLWSRWLASRDLEARSRLLAVHLPYAKTVAATYYGRRRHDEIEFDEYLQHARLGMLEAFDRFEPHRGVLFRTFAARRMHGSILDGIERASEKQQQIAVRVRLRKEPDREPGGIGARFAQLAEAGIGSAICRFLGDTGLVERLDDTDHDADEPCSALERSQLKGTLEALVRGLPAQQKSVIRSHYLQDQSFEVLSRTLRVTRGRICQIHRAGLAALRQSLAPGAAS